MNKLLNTDEYWFQMMKVIELGFYKTSHHSNFEWNDYLLIHVTGRQVL